MGLTENIDCIKSETVYIDKTPIIDAIVMTIFKIQYIEQLFRIVLTNSFSDTIFP